VAASWTDERTSRSCRQDAAGLSGAANGLTPE
jgi:hypothetical protein